MDVLSIRNSYIILKQNILSNAINFLKSFSTVELEEISKNIIKCSPVLFTEEEQAFIQDTVMKHFHKECVMRKEAEVYEEIETIKDDEVFVLIENEKQIENPTEYVLKIKTYMNQLKEYIHELYIPTNTSAYNDFTSRSTEEIIMHFDEQEKMDFFQLNQFKKDITSLLDGYLLNYEDSYDGVCKHFFFPLYEGIETFLSSGKKTSKSKPRQKQKKKTSSCYA